MTTTTRDRLHPGDRALPILADDRDAACDQLRRWALEAWRPSRDDVRALAAELGDQRLLEALEEIDFGADGRVTEPHERKLREALLEARERRLETLAASDPSLTARMVRDRIAPRDRHGRQVIR